MRPFGHTEARKERRPVVSLDSRLDAAWKKHRAYVANGYRYGEEKLVHAVRMLEPMRPTIAELHALILRTDHTDKPSKDAIASFITAGYQSLPEREIHYDLDTPWLNLLGERLEGKHLIIDGRTGVSTGWNMRGNLTVRGKTGDRTGEYMRGTLSIAGTAGSGVGNRMRGRLTISGTVDFSVGWEMGGTLRITGKAGPFAGESMVGECIITGQADYRVGDAMTGALVIEGQAGRYPGNGLIGLYSAKGRHSWLTYRSSHEVFSASHNDTRVTDAIAQEFRMRLRRFARTVCYDSIWDDDDLVDVGIFHEKPDLERWHRFRRRIHRRYGVEL